MPNPKQGESKETFISRFMSDESMKKKYPDKEQRMAIALSHWKSPKESFSVKENLSFSFTPEYSIKESTDGRSKWLQIGGTALTEGVSKNGRAYSIENMQENDGRDFSWLVGHPDDASHPNFIVGEGKLTFKDNKLLHEGKVRNTANYPDIMEKVRDGLVVPSIHATADKVERQVKEGVETYKITGLKIPGVGLVNKNFQGVEGATVDFAIAESFNALEAKHSDDKDEDKEEEMPKPKKKKSKMKGHDSETTKKDKLKDEVKEMEEQELKKLQEANEALKKEIAEMKESAKKTLVSQIMELNGEMKEAELMEKDESMLKTVLEYEKKLSVKESEEEAAPEGEENAGEAQAVEEPAEEEKAAEESDSLKGIIVEKDGITMSKELYESFNKELKERLM